MMRSRMLAMLMATVFLATPAAAQQATPDEVARDGLQKLMRAMELFIGTIPLYEAPEVLPNGDIIIRRVPPSDATQPERAKPQPRPDNDDRA